MRGPSPSRRICTASTTVAHVNISPISSHLRERATDYIIQVKDMCHRHENVLKVNLTVCV